MVSGVLHKYAKSIHVIKNLDSCRRGYPFSSVNSGVDPEGFTPFARLADLYHTHIHLHQSVLSYQ